jgi:hypothetical protein
MQERRKESKTWLACAQKSAGTWRLTFLRAARKAHETARADLEQVLAWFGPISYDPPRPEPVESLPPLEALVARVAALREELEGDERSLQSLEAELASDKDLRGLA